MPQFNQSSAILLHMAVESGITDPKELANIMGNASVETWGFTTMHENLRYKSAEALISKVSSADERFSMQEIRDAIASRDPERIGTIAYENRADLGNTEPGDGWRYHGRGYFQYTGRDNYTRYGEKFGVDLANNPDQAAEPALAARLAIAYWKDKVPENLRSDPEAAGRIINGGSNGAQDRVARSAEWEREITPELVAGIQNGTITLDQLATMGRGSPARDAMADGVLREREHGPAVKELQERLVRLGYTDERGRPLQPDGDFGPSTKQAVQAFQRAHGLDDDGVAGRDTLAQLRQASDQRTPLQASSPLISDRNHPDNAMYVQAVTGLQLLKDGGGFQNREQLERAAATLVYEAKVSGMSSIDNVVASTDGKRLFAVEGQLSDPASKRVVTDSTQATAQSIEQTTKALSQDVPGAMIPPGNQQQSKPMQM